MAQAFPSYPHIANHANVEINPRGSGTILGKFGLPHYPFGAYAPVLARFRTPYPPHVHSMRDTSG